MEEVRKLLESIRVGTVECPLYSSNCGSCNVGGECNYDGSLCKTSHFFSSPFCLQYLCPIDVLQRIVNKRSLDKRKRGS